MNKIAEVESRFMSIRTVEIKYEICYKISRIDSAVQETYERFNKSQLRELKNVSLVVSKVY